MTIIDKFNKIISYLDSISEEKYNFSTTIPDNNGSNVLGMFPFIFNDWEYDYTYNCIKKKNGNVLLFSASDVKQYLDISQPIYLALFGYKTYYQKALKLPITSKKSKLKDVIIMFKYYTDNYLTDEGRKNLKKLVRPLLV